MDWINKDSVALAGVIFTFLGMLVANIFSYRNNRIATQKQLEVNKVENEKQIKSSNDMIIKQIQESDIRQNERLNSVDDRLNGMEMTNNKVMTIMELRVFEKFFIRKFKNTNKKMISKLSIDDSLKTFLKVGVSEIAKVFAVIIESQFVITDEEIEAEFSDAQIGLSSKFKGKNPEYAKFKQTVESEVLNFIKFYQDVKTLENGDRMDKFKELCEVTTSKIIIDIAR